MHFFLPKFDKKGINGIKEQENSGEEGNDGIF